MPGEAAMSAAAQGQLPEPTGADRLQRARLFLEMKTKYGIKPDDIADREGLSRSLVYRMIKEAERADAALGPVPAAVAPAPDPAPAPRKMGEAALLRRAWMTMHLHGGLSVAGPVAQMFWLKAVMAIRGEGDGAALLFDEAGYADGADFAACFAGTPEALALLFRRRVLLDLDGAGIGLPAKLGLLPREKLGGKLVPGLGGLRADRRQSEMLHLVSGGRSDVVSESTARGDSVDSESTKTADFGHSESTQGVDSVDSPIFPRGVMVDGDDKEYKEYNDLIITINQEGRAHESTQMGVSVDSESTDRGVAVDSLDMELARDVLRLAGLNRLPKAEDIALVQGWLAAGDRPEAIRGGVRATMLNAKGVSPSSLAYFDTPLRRARKNRRRAAASGLPDPVTALPVSAPGLPAASGLPDPVAALPVSAPGLPAAAPGPSDAEIEAQIARAEAWADPLLSARWARIRSRLKAEVGDVEHRTWLRQLALTAVDGDEVTVSQPTKFLRDRSAMHHGNRLTALWRSEDPEIRRVTITVVTRGSPLDTS